MVKKILVLVGVGLSAGSGIPTFRTDDGDWQAGMDLQSALQINEYMGRPKARKIVWDRLRSADFSHREPTIAHEALARLDEAGSLLGVLTQNIDSPEQEAGVSPLKVWQVHGSAGETVCDRCEHERPTREILDALYGQREWSWTGGKTLAEVDAHVLHCQQWNAKKSKPCGGVIKPCVVFYGEGIDRKAWSNARSALFYADELWCVGASLEVHPAADLPRMAVSLGKTVRVVSTGVVNIEGVKPAAWEKVTATADDAAPKLVDMVLGSGGD